MNTKTVYSAYLFAALNICTFAARAEASASQPDIQHVVSVTEDAGSSAICGIVNSHLTYLDSQGQQHVFDYRKFSSHCYEGS